MPKHLSKLTLAVPILLPLAGIASPGIAQATEERGASLLSSVQCPRAYLRTEWGNQLGEDKTIEQKLGLEAEILKLCIDRMKLIHNFADKLDKQKKDGAAGVPLLASTPGNSTVGKAPDQDLSATISATLKKQTTKTTTIKPKKKRAAPKPPNQLYGAFTVYGMGTDLTAGITDGKNTWWKGDGEELPGNLKIVSVTNPPMKVVVRKNRRDYVLPLRKWPVVQNRSVAGQ